MRDRDLYAQILGIARPWKVVDVKLDNESREVVVTVSWAGGKARCPECKTECGRHDHRTRRWRHLDTCQYRTILEADVSRVSCPDHGVLQVDVPWSEPGSRFTALFESLVIDWLKETSLSAVARHLGMTWDELNGVMQRAVVRGLRRRKAQEPEFLTVDETSFQKRHEYVTVVADMVSGGVLDVQDGHGFDSLCRFYRSLDPAVLEGIQGICMDMSPAFISATMMCVPDAEAKIAFDKFHVAKNLGEAVNEVRKVEHRSLQQSGRSLLARTKYVWLQNPNNMKDATLAKLDLLKDSTLKTARAWAIKEMAMSLWGYWSAGWARKAWEKWYAWAIRSQLEPIKKAARTIKAHLYGILNAITMRVTNALAESLNSKIQRVKRLACGFRNRDRFRAAIYFHLGKLNLYPEVLATYTKS